MQNVQFDRLAIEAAMEPRESVGSSQCLFLSHALHQHGGSPNKLGAHGHCLQKRRQHFHSHRGLFHLWKHSRITQYCRLWCHAHGSGRCLVEWHGNVHAGTLLDALQLLCHYRIYLLQYVNHDL